MRTRRMSPTRLAVLDYVKANQPARRSAVAERLGIAENTVSVHLKALCKAGMLHRWRIDSSFCVWSETPKLRPAITVRPVPQHVLRAHEQVSSVWEYARRCGA